MIPLDQIKIGSPCQASWDAMDGDGSVRFCGKCARNVYNLSEMTAAEAQSLVTEAEGKLCVRFYQRADGTMMTSDCPVGIRAVRRQYVATHAWAVSVLVVALTGASLLAIHLMYDPPHGQPLMGSVASNITASS